MEVDGSGDGDGGGDCAAVEVAENKGSAEGEPKVKRRMKTPLQLEILEKTYAIETYPSESLRAELSVKLGLSDRQLQMWFCHRRLKDRKAPAEKKPKKSVLPCAVEGPSAANASQLIVDNADVAKEPGGGLSLFGGEAQAQPQPQPKPRVVHKVGTAVPRISAEVPAMRRFYEPPLAISEQRAIAFVEAQLGEPLREDGPILGMEFDPLPPGAFGAPIVSSNQRNAVGRPYDTQSYERSDGKPIKGASGTLHEYQFLPEKPSVRNDAYGKVMPPHCYGSPTGRSIMQSNEQAPSGYSSHSQMPSLSLLPQHGRQGHRMSPAGAGEVDFTPGITPLMNVNIDGHYNVHPINGLKTPLITKEKRIVNDQERLERKRKSEEARIAKEVEAHEKRIRKELEKQDMLRRKREEQIRREMERQDRERRKEEERLLREKQREEERYQREQRREMERREKFLQKEYIRAEKTRLKEEMRKEKVAARLKAANDRAAARRIAKESMELIEDEQLELMELAALSKGLSSFSALDNDCLQDLDLFKDILVEFPPKSVNLKCPFEVQPWNGSEENVGNLLMVWRFLITFSDVLGLWPFTLDEFTQALHDCDPRLLGEIHIAVLRSILNGIEDVSRTPATLVTNQNSVVPGGSHPQIVEGAYTWGFDLVSWKSNLTPLSWPEVLRQIALAAGFGPKLKKQNMGQPYLHDEQEGDDGGEDVISNLRNGVAAENAVAIMQERGLSNRGRSRHRLTPGTVKYAAFHVLSLEGSKGLSILDVAHKIQKSGLRDLTTSKTPEASISAALSRDTKLFERVAPSTYCVLSPYRKDSADAEAVLSAAREKIRLYQNGNLDAEAEDVEKDDGERDQDSESDTADDPDVDDLDSITKHKKDSHSERRTEDKNGPEYGKGNSCNELVEISQDTLETPNCSLKHSVVDIKCNGKSVDPYEEGIAGIHSQIAITDQEDYAMIGITDQEENVIDECGFGEPWVLGLTEGDYADLSVEERLHVLIALISVANEGNTMRIVLEERLEAANALKKQMWAEAKLDKRRMKEEHALKLHQSSVPGDRAEQHLPSGTFDDRRSPLSCDVKNLVSSTSNAFQMVDLNEQHNEQSCCNDSDKNRIMQEFTVPSDSLLLQPSACTSEKSRSELKALIGHQAEEMYVYRSLPLGLDRRRNRYWQFITSPSRNDPGTGKLFVELCNGAWRLIDSEEGFDALMSSLDIRGVREYHLHSMLQRIEVSFREAARKNLLCKAHYQHPSNQDEKGILQMKPKIERERWKSTECASYSASPYSSVPFAFGLEKDVMEENELIVRYKDVEKWMRDECFDSNKFNAIKFGRLRRQLLLGICNCCHDLFACDENHCPFCHSTYSSSDESFNFPQHVARCNGKPSEGHDRITMKLSLSPRVRLLKAQLATIEASTPSEALESFWSDAYRRSWGMKLHRASTAEELLQILTLFENSIKRDFLSENYEATGEILYSSKILAYNSRPEEVAVLPWIPKTTSAVAFRAMELDSSIYYTADQKEARQKDNEASGYSTRLPSRGYALGCLDSTPQDSWADLHTNLKRGRGRPRGPSRTQGGKAFRKAITSYDESCQRSTTKKKFGELQGWKGQPLGKIGRKKGRRSIRRRQKPTKRIVKNSTEQSAAKDSGFDDDTPVLQEEEWNLVETQTEAAGAKNDSSSERSEFYEDNSQASGDEYDDDLSVDFSGARNPKSGGCTTSYKMSRDENKNEIGDEVDDNDEDGVDDAEDEPEQEQVQDLLVDRYFNSNFHEEAQNHSAGGGGQVRNVVDRVSVSDGGSGSSSSDFSY